MIVCCAVVWATDKARSSELSCKHRFRQSVMVHGQHGRFIPDGGLARFPRFCAGVHAQNNIFRAFIGCIHFEVDVRPSREPIYSSESFRRVGIITVPWKLSGISYLFVFTRGCVSIEGLGRFDEAIF